MVIRTRAVLYEKTSKQRNLILRVNSFQGICCRAEASLVCLWRVSERGKAPPPRAHTSQLVGLLLLHTQLLKPTELGRKMKLSPPQAPFLLLPQTQNCCSQPLSRNLHTAVMRQRTKRIRKTTEKGSEKLQSRETQTNAFSSADLLWLPPVLLSASQAEREIPARFDSERVLKITDRIKV